MPTSSLNHRNGTRAFSPSSIALRGISRMTEEGFNLSDGRGTVEGK
jgi:hypothetical protein